MGGPVERGRKIIDQIPTNIPPPKKTTINNLDEREGIVKKNETV